MRYLSLAPFAAGPTDHEFLDSILFRATHELASELSDSPVEIAENFVRGGSNSAKGGSRPDRLERAFGSALSSGAINVLFVHADGDGDEPSARSERFAPCAAKALSLVRDANLACVPVIPNRMTEAWALADTSALISALDTRKTAEQLNIMLSASAVEALTDPKEVLAQARANAVGLRKRRIPQRETRIPANLAPRIDLRELRRLAAYRRFESDLATALRALWNLQTT